MSAVGTGTNRLMDLARKSDITVMDEIHFDFNCDMDLPLTHELDAYTSLYRFNVSNSVGDKLYDLSCQWTANCATFGRRAGKKSKKFAKKMQNIGTVFRTLPIQSCTFNLQKNLLDTDLHAFGTATPNSKSQADAGGYNINARIRVSEGCGNTTLMDVLRDNKRISEKNIYKWTSQMLEILISYHNVSVCLKQFTANDLLIASDKSVLLLYQTERLMATASKGAARAEAREKEKERLEKERIENEKMEKEKALKEKEKKNASLVNVLKSQTSSKLNLTASGSSREVWMKKKQNAADIDRVESGIVRRVESGVTRVESGISRADSGITSVGSGVSRADSGITRAESGVSRAESGGVSVGSGVSRVESCISRAESGVSRAESGVIRAESGIAVPVGDDLKELGLTVEPTLNIPVSVPDGVTASTMTSTTVDLTPAADTGSTTNTPLSELSRTIASVVKPGSRSPDAVNTGKQRSGSPPKNAAQSKAKLNNKDAIKKSALTMRVVEDDDDQLLTETERIMYTRDVWYNPRTWFEQAVSLKPIQPLLSRHVSRGGSRNRSRVNSITRGAVVTGMSIDGSQSIPETGVVEDHSLLTDPLSGINSVTRGDSVMNDTGGDDDSTIASVDSEAAPAAAESSIVVLPPVRAAIKIFDPNEKHLPKFFPAVAACEKNKLDIRILAMSVEYSMTDTVREFDKFAEGCREDLRSMGLLILQLLFRRPFTTLELEKYSNLTRFTTPDLNDIISLHKYSACFRRIVEICFDPAEEHEIKEAKKFGAKIINCAVSYHREIRSLRQQLKEEVALLFNDFNSEPKEPPFWTKEDEEARVKEAAERLVIDVQVGKNAQQTACARVNEERKKLWFELQPKKIQEKILRQKKAAELAEANKKARNLLVHRAGFHCWEEKDQSKWLERVLYENLMRAWHLKKNAKKLEMYIQNFVSVMLKPIPAMLPKVLVRFGTDYYGLDPNCSKEERDKDIVTCIKTFSVEVVFHLVKRFNNRKLLRALENAAGEAERKMEKSSILSILPPDQYVLKKRQLESEYLAANFPRIRDAVKLFSSDIVFVNRDFSNKTTLTICTAIVEKWWAEADVRTEGENLAACRIQALYHSYRARKVYQEVLKSYENNEKRKAYRSSAKGGEVKSKKQAAVMEEMLYEQRLRDEEEEKKKADALKLKEAHRVEIHSVEAVEDGADIVIAVDLSHTEFGESVNDRSNMTTVTKLLKKAVYKNIMPKVVTDMIVGGVDEANQVIDSRAGTAVFKDRVDIPPKKSAVAASVKAVDRSGLNKDKAAVEEADNVGEVAIIVTDARYPVGREERDGVVDTVTTRIQFLGFREPKWSRRGAEERAERERLGEKHPKQKEGKQLVKYSLRGLTPGCTYTVNLSLRSTFVPRKKVMHEYLKSERGSGVDLVLGPIDIKVKATAPSSPSGITSRILRYPHMPLPPVAPFPLDHAYALDHPPMSVVDDLRSIMFSTTLLDRKWQAEANKDPKIAAEPLKHRIEVQWNPSRDNGSAIKSYKVYRVIDPVQAEVSSDGVTFSKKDLRTQIAGKDVQRSIEFQFEPDKHPWRKVAKVTGTSHVDLIDDATMFPPGSNASYSAVYYKVMAINTCGRSSFSEFTSVLHVDRSGDQPSALLDVNDLPEEPTSKTISGAPSAAITLKRSGSINSPASKRLPQLAANETAALNSEIDTVPYLEMMISSRPGTVNNSSSKSRAIESPDRVGADGDRSSASRSLSGVTVSSRAASRQTRDVSGLGATSAVGSHQKQDQDLDGDYLQCESHSDHQQPIIPMSWIDNIPPHTSNKVSLNFYSAGLEPSPHDPSDPVHESLQDLPYEQVADMEKWLVQLSRACPLKPVDNSAVLLSKMLIEGSSTRVENANSPLGTQILGQKIKQQNRGKQGKVVKACSGR